MSRFTDRLEQDLATIADRAAPSPTAWEAIRQRVARQEPDQEVEMIMLSPDHEPSTGRRRIWWAVAAAAALVVAVVAGVVITRDDEDGSMVSRPDTTDPAPEDPDTGEPDPEQPDPEQPVEEPEAEEPVEPPVEDPVPADGTDELAGPPTSVELVREIPDVLRPPRNPTFFAEGVLAGSNAGAYEVYDVTTGERLGVGPYGEFVYLPDTIITLAPIITPEVNTWEIRDLSETLVGELLETTSFPVAGSVDAVMMADGTVFQTETGEVIAEVEEGWSPLRVYGRDAVLANEDTRTLRAVTVPDLETIWEVDDIVVDVIVPGALGDSTTGVTVSVDTGEVIAWVPDEARPDELCPVGTDGAGDGPTEVSLESSVHAVGYWATIVRCGTAGSDTGSNTLVVFSDVDGSVVASIEVGEVSEVYADGRYVVTEPTGGESIVEVYLVS